MKKIFAIVTAITLFTLATVPAMAAKEDPLDTAIREASNYLNTKIPAGSKVAFINISGGYPDLADYVLGDLGRNGVNDGKFTVVDRAQLDTVRAELNFNSSGEVSDSSAQAIGQVLGAQTIVTGGVRKIGNNFRLDVKAIEVQTAKVQGDWSSKNIPNKNMIADLTKRTGSTSTATANASGGKSGGASTGSTAAAAPAVPKIKDGTYTFWPRPRAMKQGRDINAYLEKIVVRGGYFTFYVVEVPVGNGRDRGDIPENHQSIITDLDNPSRPPLSSITENSYNNYESENGRFASFWVFENHSIRRFSFTNLFEKATFEEIIMPDEPDSN